MPRTFTFAVPDGAWPGEVVRVWVHGICLGARLSDAPDAIALIALRCAMKTLALICTKTSY